MTTLALIAYYSRWMFVWTYQAAQIGAVVLGVWALVDSLIRPANLFVAADKRTKGFWIAVNAAGVAVAGLMGWQSMFGLLGFVANGVYLADVRPALIALSPVRVRSRIRRPGDHGGPFGGRR